VKPILQIDTRPVFRRRGVTLVEMLVTVAMLVIIMTILVQVFAAATTALSAAQKLQEIDNQLKLLDGTIRSDLTGVTAKFTPPVDPADGKGYFEYGENEFADVQGEDSDDYIRFTASCPPGRPFTGRFFVPPPIALSAMSTQQLLNYYASQPITITSEYAEIIYFLRNGNLYRRVLLVAPPAMQSAIYQMANNQDTNGNYLLFNNSSGGPAVSWQGLNDLSARPAASGSGPPITLNTLNDLTNRENRFAYSRFANDFLDLTQSPAAFGQDGVPDDINGDNVWDIYPTLYPNIVNNGLSSLIFAPGYQSPSAVAVNQLGFPYVFPGAYSQAQALPNVGQQVGWIHAPSPYTNVLQASGTASSLTSFDGSLPKSSLPDALAYLQSMNHNPIDVGDNLPTPANPAPGNTSATVFATQTWWGFPTWRETLSPNWNDPTWQVNVVYTGFNSIAQPNGLIPLTYPGKEITSGAVNYKTRWLLPAMNSNWRINPQPFTDGYGDTPNLFFPAGNNVTLWNYQSWEDDLIMTNVRSFDVKAYDDLFAGYVDLGWGDDARITGGAQYLTQTPLTTTWNANIVPTLTGTFAHEGRMPPLTADNVYDARYGQATYPNQNKGYTGNIGDDTVEVVRLRRVWDSWSTEYSKAPATGVYPPATVGGNAGFPLGPPLTQPVYPSYPAPYQAPLRGIQIQIRVADPTNQKVKSITIRQDFTDKL
jgi:prepilin-type N-terminal cleavage/methylation domain-containing protein